MNTDPAQPHRYTAAQLAKAFGKAPRHVRRWLAEVQESGVSNINNKPAKVYALSALPALMRDQIEARARAKGYRDAGALLGGQPARWESSVALVDCADSAVQKAIKLRDALATPLALRDDTSLSRAEFEQIGLRDYCAVFGHAITGRQWWNVFNRTLERIGAEKDLRRLELYLDERPARKPQPAPLPAAGAQPDQFLEITRRIGLCHNPNELGEADARSIWMAALETYTAAVELGEPPRVAKASVLAFLHKHAPALTATREALRCAFNRRLERWQEVEGKPSALRDRRAEANRQRARTLPQDDLDLLTIYAVEACGGRLSQAWRECVQDGLLSEQTAGRFLLNPAVKSHVPAIVRNEVKYDVPLMLDQARRPKHTRDNGAWIDRCWDSIPSMTWFCTDDATMPILFRVPDGNGWWWLMRGQFLVNIDARSTCILSFALMPERNYNARVIRTLMTRTFDVHGLPRRGFLWERGIWRDSRILTGDANETALDWQSAEHGLKEFGLRFIHAIRARSKPVERVIGALQSYTEGLPGYVGRAEMSDPIEPMQEAQRLFKSRKLAPENFFTLDQWEQCLHGLCERYNSEAQGGKHTSGLSPEDALEMFRSQDDPPVIPDSSWRYLVAHHKRPMRVTVNGITLPKSFGGGVYRNEQTGELRGQTVLVWFNPDEPEIITVTDMERRNPFCVERSQSVPAILEPDDVAGQELLAQELGRCEAHMNYAKTRYRVLKTKYAPQFRRNLVSPSTVRLGVEIEQQRGVILTDQRRESRLRQSAHKRARELGLSTIGLNENTELADEGTRMMQEARRNHQQQKVENTEAATGPKTYELKDYASGFTAKQRSAIYWNAWRAVEEAKPGSNRFAITARVLGSAVPIKQMSDEQFKQIVHVFRSIAGDAKTSKESNP